MTKLAVIGIAPGGITAESRGTIETDDFRKQLQALINAVTSVQLPANSSMPPLNRVKIGLAVNAKGRLGIIEAGVDASITLTFE